MSNMGFKLDRELPERPDRNNTTFVPTVRHKAHGLLLGSGIIFAGSALSVLAASEAHPVDASVITVPQEPSNTSDKTENLTREQVEILVRGMLLEQSNDPGLSVHEQAWIREFTNQMKSFDTESLVALLGLLMNGVGIFIIWGQLKIMSREIDRIEDTQFTNTFLSFTDRFNRISEMLHGGNTVEAEKASKQYFELCSQEYFLWRKGSIPDDVWREWSGGMRACMKKSVFQEAWKQAKQNSDWYGAEFIAFIDSLVPTDTTAQEA